VKAHALIDVVAAEVPLEELALLEDDAQVTRVSIDADVASEAGGGNGNSQGGGSVSSLLATLGLPMAGLTGQGVGVAVLDSGVDHTGDFSNIAAYDFTTGQSGASYDDYGHGTHVAGLIAGKGSQSQHAYEGIAPGVRLISLKVLDSQGHGSTSTVIDALEFAVSNRNTLGIDVINLSLGHPIFEPAATDPLVQAVEAAVRAGIVVVVSAGNVGRSLATGEPGYAGILSPANAPSAITVGALDSRNTTARGDDAVTTYSSRGPTWYDALAKPDLVAPGHELVSTAAIGSTLYLQYPERRVAGNGNQNRYLRLSGTSLSAAVASGAVALTIEATRSAYGLSPSPDTIKAILEYSALPVGTADPLAQGHGALNVSGAIALALAAGPNATPETLPLAPIQPTTTIGGEAQTWAQAFGFNDTVVWGNTDGTPPAWAQTVVWGNFGWGDTVVWGNADTIVWGSLFTWGDTVVWGNTNGIY
jgi:serine protease AprX